MVQWIITPSPSGGAVVLIAGYPMLTRVIANTGRFLIASAVVSGRSMILLNKTALTGGALAFVTYALVVVSAPMLLNRNANVFAAVATSM